MTGDEGRPDWHGRWDILPGESWPKVGEEGLRELQSLAQRMERLCRRLGEEAGEQSDETLSAFAGEVQDAAHRIEVGACRLAASAKRMPAGRDVVDEASMESFPASDPATAYRGA